MKMIDCKEVLANISCYVDGDGAADLRALLKAHIARCRSCRVIFDTTGKMLAIVSDSAPFDVPLAAKARLYARLEKLLTDA